MHFSISSWWFCCAVFVRRLFPQSRLVLRVATCLRFMAALQVPAFSVPAWPAEFPLSPRRATPPTDVAAATRASAVPCIKASPLGSGTQSTQWSQASEALLLALSTSAAAAHGARQQRKSRGGLRRIRGSRAVLRGVAGRKAFKLEVDLPVPELSTEQMALLKDLPQQTLKEAQRIAAALPGADQLPVVGTTVAEQVSKLKAQLPPETFQYLEGLNKMLPPDVLAVLQDPSVLEPIVQPGGYGALLVWLLALRRGPQPYLDQLPLRYDGPWIEAYWARRPLRLFRRFAEVSVKAGGFSVGVELDKLFNRDEEMMPQRAAEAKELITDLGPAFVKIVQVWASRPDVLPEPYQKELEQLLERVRPFGKGEALQTLRRNMSNDKFSEYFPDTAVFETPTAAASIGQVYKTTVQGREVAVKVQRPDVREQVTLDLFVIRRIANLGSYLPIERYARQFASLFELIDRAAPPFIEELDYENEACNQRLFAKKIAECELVCDTVAVPEVLFSSREVLVQEWLPGKKLTEPGAAKEQADRVVKVLLNSYMVQFLETGFLHGDPHPGNFVLMPSGKIGILDYGLMTTISEDKRVAFIEYIMHVQAKMFDECLTDLVNLEFLPRGIADDKEAREVIVPGLADTLTILFEQSDLRVQREKFIKQRDDLKASGKLEQLQEKLQAIARKYGSFRLPGYMTLIIRALATLEGVGLRTNESFALTKELFPYIARRLLTDDSLRIREALRAYLYKGRTRIQVQRVDDLADGFRTFTNLMKGSRSKAAEAGAPVPMESVEAMAVSSSAAIVPSSSTSMASEIPQAATAPGTSQTQDVDIATRDIAAVIFSPQGNFLQDLLIDEGVAAIDALSRAAFLQLIRSLGPLFFPMSLPLNLVARANPVFQETAILAREDKEALLLIRRIAQYAQAAATSENTALALPGNANNTSVATVAQDLQRLRPFAQGLLPTVLPGIQAFAQRFAQQLARRALQRMSSDIERSVGLRPEVVSQ